MICNAVSRPTCLELCCIQITIANRTHSSAGGTIPANHPPPSPHTFLLSAYFPSLNCLNLRSSFLPFFSKFAHDFALHNFLSRGFICAFGTRNRRHFDFLQTYSLRWLMSQSRFLEEDTKQKLASSIR